LLPDTIQKTCQFHLHAYLSRKYDISAKLTSTSFFGQFTGCHTSFGAFAILNPAAWVISH